MNRIGLCLLLSCWVAPVPADDLDREPINYKTATADNAVSALHKRLDAEKWSSNS